MAARCSLLAIIPGAAGRAHVVVDARDAALVGASRPQRRRRGGPAQGAPEVEDAGAAVGGDRGRPRRARRAGQLEGGLRAERCARRSWVGLGLAVIQQVTGINAVIYYSDEIFKEAGFASAEEQAKATLYAIGRVNVLATFIAIAYVDRFGRKPLLRAGLIGMTTTLLALGLAFTCSTRTTRAAAAGERRGHGSPSSALVVYIASFAFSLGPVVWTMINRDLPEPRRAARRCRWRPPPTGAPPSW